MLILIMFWAAQLVLGVALWAGLRIPRREPNLAGRLAAVTEIRHRPTRLDAARREIVWARSEIDIIVEQLDRARRRLNELIPLPESSGSIIWFVVLTGILYEGESGVALLLNLASGFANMSDAVAAFVSPILAVALIAALHVILGSLIQIGAEHRPQRVLHRAKLGAVAGGTAVLLSAWMVLSGRSFTDPQMIETIASWGLLTLVLLLSVAGAFASLVVTTVNDERAVERRVGRLLRLETALERHIEAVQRDIDQQDGRPSNVCPLTAVGGGSAALAVVLATLLAGPVAAQTTSPAQRAGAVPGDARTGSARVVTPHSCETLVDVSLSVDALARQEAVERMSADLETVVAVFGCEVFRFSAFSGDPPFNVLQEMASPLPVAPLKSCEAAAPTEKGTAVSGAVQALYPNVRAARDGEAVRQCASSERQRYDGDVRNRQKLLDDARVMWRAVACTGLDFAVRRAIGRSRHVLVLSDGANTCGTPRVQSSPRLVTGQTLTFLLLPSTGPDAAARGLRHMARLEAAYSSSRVLFFSELTPTVWQSLNTRGESYFRL
jgi:hypothetical protein